MNAVVELDTEIDPTPPVRVNRTPRWTASTALRSALLAPVFALLLSSLVWPMATVVLRSLSPQGSPGLQDGVSWQNYLSIATDGLLRQVMMETGSLALLATVVTLAIAFPTAYLMSRLSPRAAFILLMLVMLPFWVSILVRLFAFTVILGRKGVVNTLAESVGAGPFDLLYNTPSVVIGMVAYLLPYMLLVLYAGMAGVDASLIAAAKTMGASGRYAFTHVYLPMIRSTVVSGSLLVFVLALGFFLTPAILGGPQNLTVPVYIQQQITIFQWGQASASGIVLAAISLIGYGFAIRMSGTSIFAAGAKPLGKGTVAREPLRRNASTISLWLCTAIALVVLLLPLLVVIPAAFNKGGQLAFPSNGFSTRWFESVFTDPQWGVALWKSVRVGVLTAILSTAIGLALARVVSAVQSKTGKTVLQTLAFSPLVIPVILLAVGNYDVQVRTGLVGTDFGLIVVHTLIAFPLCFLVISNALNNIDGSLEEAAWSMGGSRIRTFWTVIVPNMYPAIGGALVIAFMTSWDEAVLSLFQTGLEKTLPVTIFSALKSGVTPAVAAVAVLLMIPVALVVVVVLVRGERRRRNQSI